MITNRDQLVVALVFAGRYLLDSAVSELRTQGRRISSTDLGILLVLYAHSSCSQSDVAALLGRDKTTLSRAVASLEDRGLVYAKLDPVDGRRKALELSEAGLAVAAPALQTIRAKLDRAAPPDAVEACLSLVERLAKDILVA